MSPSRLRDQLYQIAREETTPDAGLARQFLESPELSTTDLLTAAGIPREKHFGKEVRIHILNNVRNGHCGEDCGYCAQRKTAPEDVPAYADKTETEILAEAKAAYDSGAFRYCMVTSGRGPGPRSVERYADLIRKIKSLYPLEVCLSAGIVTDSALARELASAGLDRYNHNLNTSREHYEQICTTHDYDDRMATLETMQSAGVSLCSGVIAGMGEQPYDLVAAALTLRERRVPSIPVNFFIPVQGHAIDRPARLNADYCLRVLALFRLVNPRSEIRMAAGREIHLGDRQPEGLQAANSLFVSGYLNVRGSDAHTTIRMIRTAGYTIDTRNSDLPTQLQDLLVDAKSESIAGHGTSVDVTMKDLAELRPYQKS